MRNASAIATSVEPIGERTRPSRSASACRRRHGRRPARRRATRLPPPSCWTDALKLMKLPRSRGSTLPVMSAIAGPKRPGTQTKNSDRDPDGDGERRAREVRQRSSSGTSDGERRRSMNSRCLP